MEPFLFDKIKKTTPSFIGLGNCREAAVCIPLLPGENGYEVLFEVRSLQLGPQPGDICFPGGMLEPGEEAKDGALRELEEELLVSDSQVEVIAQLDYLWVNRLLISSFLVVLHSYEGSFFPGEVSEVFRVPLSFFLAQKPEVYEVRLIPEPEDGFPYARIYGGENYQWKKRVDDVLFYQYKERAIWGITAKIMDAFVQKMVPGPDQ